MKFIERMGEKFNRIKLQMLESKAERLEKKAIQSEKEWELQQRINKAQKKIDKTKPKEEHFGMPKNKKNPLDMKMEI